MVESNNARLVGTAHPTSDGLENPSYGRDRARLARDWPHPSGESLQYGKELSLCIAEWHLP